MPLFGSTLAGASGGVSVYSVPGSIWFDGTADYLSRAPVTVTSQKLTISCWIKRLELGYSGIVGNARGTSMPRVQFTPQNKLSIINFANSENLTSTEELRDDAWFHLVIVYDTTQATASDRCRVWINNVEMSLTGTFPTLNNTLNNFWSTEIWWGRVYVEEGSYGKNLLSQCVLGDDVVLLPGDLGELDSNGVWRPVDISDLTYGTEGSLLDFSNSAALGDDVSGNANNWTLNSITSANASVDTPSSPKMSMSPIAGTQSEENILDGGTRYKGVNTTYHAPILTGLPSTGKYYFEMVLNNNGQFNFGLVDGASHSTSITDGFDASSTFEWIIFANGGGTQQTRYNNVGANSRSADTDNDVFQLAIDLDAGELWFGRNDTWYGTGAPEPDTGTDPTYSSVVGNLYVFLGSGSNGAAEVTLTLGADNAYATPTGYTAYNGVEDLPSSAIPDGSRHFSPILYTGNGVASGSGGNAVTGLEFQPDFVWIKNRDAADNHMLFDVIRGVSQSLSADTTAVETTDSESLSSFDSGGFTLGSNVAVNTNTERYAAWCWKAGGTPSSNTSGTITASVSANTTAGFSVTTYTGTGVAATIGHGLGKVPGIIIVKERTNDVGNWFVFHGENTSAPETDHLLLNTTAATADDATVWNDTAPTSAVFSVGTNDDVNGSGDTYVAYCWAEIEGYSKFGSYTGSGLSDGPYVYLGFRPSFVMIKRANSTSSWHVYDNLRDGYNPDNNRLVTDAASAETTSYEIDLLSCGFKLRISTDPNVNTGKYIYAAFAEYPSGGVGLTPAPGR